MDALKQSLLRAEPAKPPGSGAQQQSGAPAAIAAIDARFSALDRKLDTLIQMLQGPDGEQSAPQYLLTADIRRVLTLYFKLPERELDRDGRSAKIAHIRQIGYYLCRAHTTRSLQEIGRIFGGRDHTTVVHGVRKIGTLRKTDAALEGALAKLEARLAELLARRGTV